ncbi:dimethyl sulfoxide reductase anchor subunit family protein [Salisediminibacterium beveridgei]|uniref:Anaerobic dimethyl sulfoxide reductase chain C n=1 Tax=Salisediminibacterium beveridgei TaxID=632773 RepID=A0A1D7QRX4_9BACI|nr:DmsC/YnfH family molybdoenzyme membrane anchor subunit [Salisediminibacterium beveridgei]AOM81733.1 Anaerobic dimethyl sulfoxide reductase chain C [Salisediminibacterium beveridgei]
MFHVLAEEWQLLLFTLMMQAAVGTFLFVVILRSRKKLDLDLRKSVTRKGLLVTGPLVIIGILLSALHLGDPLGAYRSILNVSSSWLSREIVFTGLFFAMWAVAFILDRKDKWNSLFGWLTVLAGAGAVVSMASIYATSIIPAWTDFNTYLTFFGTAIFFGVAIMVMILLTSSKRNPDQVQSVLKSLAITGGVVLIVQLAYLPVFLSGLSTAGAAGVQSLEVLSSQHIWSIMIRWTLSLGGIGLILYALFRSKPLQAGQYGLIYAAFSMILVGEFLGRYIFYATGVPMFIG